MPSPRTSSDIQAIASSPAEKNRPIPKTPHANPISAEAMRETTQAMRIDGHSSARNLPMLRTPHARLSMCCVANCFSLPIGGGYILCYTPVMKPVLPRSSLAERIP
jgi:hypothetical protein